jgi:SET domain-containing protein
LCLFALRDIIKGEEITFDYKQQVPVSRSIYTVRHILLVNLCCAA